jgi:predicted histidine transporter YuiF (NhaC family)
MINIVYKIKMRTTVINVKLHQELTTKEVLFDGLPSIFLVLGIFLVVIFIYSKLPKFEETEEEKEQNRIM